MVGSAEMVSMSLMRENPRAGGASWNCTLGSGSSTAASVDPARRVWVNLRRAGDPHRGGQGCARGFSETARGDSVDQKKKDRRKSPHKLADLRERLGDFEGQLRNARAQVRQIETELLDLAQSKETIWEDLSKRAIEKYKESPGFEMGLMRMGRVSLEYGYQLALAQLQARHPGVEIELDPFVTLPEDVDVPMADEQPFDDSLPPPEE
ncbi:hypothetical protein BHM03_00019105 [Ensete ventricosum]|nr:hypothetical protein BHM03_00019105 [Ensete ventricosum]